MMRIALMLLFLTATAIGFDNDDDAIGLVGETRSVEVSNRRKSVADSFYSWARETAPELAPPVVVVHLPRSEDFTRAEDGDAVATGVVTASSITASTDSGAADGSSSVRPSRKPLSEAERKLVREIATACNGSSECIRDRCGGQQTSVDPERCVARAIAMHSRTAALVGKSKPPTPLETILAGLDEATSQRVLDVAMQAALAEIKRKNETTAANSSNADEADCDDDVLTTPTAPPPPPATEGNQMVMAIVTIVIVIIKVYIVYAFRHRIFRPTRFPNGILAQARPRPPPYVMRHETHQLSPQNP